MHDARTHNIPHTPSVTTEKRIPGLKHVRVTCKHDPEESELPTALLSSLTQCTSLEPVGSDVILRNPIKLTIISVQL